MSNTRAMQWKESAEEYDRLLADTSRLRGWIETEIADSLGHRIPSQSTWSEQVEDLRIALRVNRSAKNVVDLGLEGSKRGERPSLDTLRTVHRNLDVVIALAERCCADLGITNQFNQAKAIYGFK